MQPENYSSKKKNWKNAGNEEREAAERGRIRCSFYLLGIHIAGDVVYVLSRREVVSRHCEEEKQL